MNKLNNIWNRFAEKHPSASKWIREGGLFVIVSNLITVLKYVMLLFLPLAFAGLPNGMQWFLITAQNNKRRCTIRGKSRT